MSSVKISQLNLITQLNANTSNTLFVGVDIPSGVTGKFTGHTLAQGLYANEVLNVGNNSIIFPNTIAQFAGNSTSYLQINMQNFASNGSADMIITADTGTDSNSYIDLGINNSNYNQPSFNATRRLDGYLYVAGPSTAGAGGNLVIGTASTLTNVLFIVGGTTSSNIVAKMTNSGLNLNTQSYITYADGSIQSTAAAPFAYTNVVYGIANTAPFAYTQANASFTQANAAYAMALAGIGTANSATTLANSAFSKANNALANTTGTFAGNLTITGNLIISNTATINGTLIPTLTANGNVSAYASKHLVEYNPTTKALTYSSTPDASSPYITGYSSEIHVSSVAFNDSGKGTIGDPVKTIARAIELITPAFETTGAGQRKTIILHPGDYPENVTINTQYTVLTTHELIGKSTTFSGTLTLATGCTVDGLKMDNLVISGTSANGSIDLIGCTVTTAVTKTSTAYTNFRGCDLSSSTLSITGAGTVVLVGGNYGTVTVNNASAAVLAKAVISMGPTTLTAGTLQLSDSLVYSATNTSNAITQSAGSFLTLNNCQTLIPNLTNVTRNSFGGYYSILHSVYDKANSTFSGTSLNAIDYSQYINADNLNVQGNATITGTVGPQKGFIYTANVYSGNQTAITIDVANTAVTKANTTAGLVVTLSNLLAGKETVLWVVNAAGTNQTFTHGLSALNSTTNSTTYTIPGTSSILVRYMCIDNTLANTFVAVVHA
jgi:cytoskeletal protein CcmA (bactofilin family)